MEPTDPAAESPRFTTDAMMQLVYRELRGLAQRQLGREPAGQTLQPTALVHEVFLRLRDAGGWDSRAHFFAAAAATMRRILTEQARLKGRQLFRNAHRGELWLAEVISREDAGRLVELDEALAQLAELDPLAAQVAELRIFAGLSLAEVAEAGFISESRAFREWSFARAWLRTRLAEDS